MRLHHRPQEVLSVSPCHHLAYWCTTTSSSAQQKSDTWTLLQQQGVDRDFL